MKRIILLPCLFTAVLLVGCATTQSKYDWGGYEDSLYSYYKDPTKSAEYFAQLEQVIQDSKVTGKPLAPGLHAEYGFLLLQQGKSSDAIAQFENEKSKWPESTYLMNNLIRIASSSTNKSTASKE